MSDTIQFKATKRIVRNSLIRPRGRKRDHRRYISHLQKKVLVKYIEKYPSIVANKASKSSGEYCSNVARSKWEDLTKILNRLPGANKTWTEWRKVNFIKKHYLSQIKSVFQCLAAEYQKFFIIIGGKRK